MCGSSTPQHNTSTHRHNSHQQNTVFINTLLNTSTHQPQHLNTLTQCHQHTAYRNITQQHIKHINTRQLSTHQHISTPTQCHTNGHINTNTSTSTQSLTLPENSGNENPRASRNRLFTAFTQRNRSACCSYEFYESLILKGSMQPAGCWNHRLFFETNPK
jgi:hypothetical protein